MSNNYFNFLLPDFNERFGSDWDSFKTIVGDNVDHIIAKTIQLYWLRKPDRMTGPALEDALEFREITSPITDTIIEKKEKVRNYNVTYQEKGMDEIYLDKVEEIVGVRGDLYLASDFWDGWVFGEFVFGDPEFGIFGGIDFDNKFTIFFDVKTVDPATLAEILVVLRDKPMKAAFYQVILIDSSWNILEVV